MESNYVSVSLTVSLDYFLNKQYVYDFRELYEHIVSFYFYKNVTRSDVNIFRDPIQGKWEYTFSVSNDKGIIKVPYSAKLRLLSMGVNKYIGMKLLSKSILSFMVNIPSDITLYYKPFGVLVESGTLDYEKVRDIRSEICSKEQEYCYFVNSPAVLEMTDRFKNFYTEFGRYVIVKRDRPIIDMHNAIADILMSR